VCYCSLSVVGRQGHESDFSWAFSAGKTLLLPLRLLALGGWTLGEVLFPDRPGGQGVADFGG
jgi:hypothetical protein